MLNQRKPQDEWGHVIKAQAQASRLQDLEEAKLSELNKRRYREELDRQLNEKRQQQIEERLAHREHQNVVRQKERAINDWNDKLRQQFYEEKKNLYIDQQEHAEQKFRETQANLFQMRAEEQERLNFVQQQIEQQKQRELAHRSQKTNEQQEVLRTNEYQKQYEKRANLQEKINNEQLNIEQMERVNERDEALRNHNRRKLEENDIKTKAFEGVAAMNLQRDMNKELMVSNWHEQHQEKLNEKEEQEKKLKYDSLLNTNQILRAQLSEKEQQRQFAREQFERERQETIENANRVRQHEQAIHEQKRKEMEEYKNTLLEQAQNSQQARIDEFKFSDKEKQMHSNIIRNLDGGQNIEFRGVPGAHPRVSPLQNSYHRAYKSHAVLPTTKGSFAEAQKKFYGEEQNLFVDKKMQSTKSFEESFDPNRHDPIVNPIGVTVPRGGHGSPLVGGRALSLLYAGASITRPSQ